MLIHDINQLKQAMFCQHGRQIARGGAGLETTFVTVCGNLHHLELTTAVIPERDAIRLRY